MKAGLVLLLPSEREKVAFAEQGLDEGYLRAEPALIRLPAPSFPLAGEAGTA